MIHLHTCNGIKYASRSSLIFRVESFPFHGAIAVPSVTRCRCRRCRRRGHRCAGGARQYRWRHLVKGREAARSSEWAQHFSIFQMLLVLYSKQAAIHLVPTTGAPQNFETE